MGVRDLFSLQTKKIIIMTGQIILRENKLLIKDGEDNIPISNNSSYIAKIGSIFEFTYVFINNIKYAEIKKL